MEEKEIKIIPENKENTIEIQREEIIFNQTISGNYEDLSNKPKINDVELVGNKTLDDLGIASKEYVDDLIGNINSILATLTTVSEV